MQVYKTHARRRTAMLAALLLLVALTAACAPTPAAPTVSAPATSLPATPPAPATPAPPATSTPAPTHTRPAPQPLTEDALKNASYQGIYTETVKLTDGRYEGEPFEKGGASRPVVEFAGIFALSDLDADAAPDAAVILRENSGGSGTFILLAVVVDRDGKPENIATTALGDRVRVESLDIDEGKITLSVVMHGPADPMCCPSQKKVLTYELQGSRLVKTSEEPAPAS